MPTCGKSNFQLFYKKLSLLLSGTTYLLLFMGAAQLAAAQESLMKFNRKTSRNGLSQSFVRTITSDKNGSVWIGTSDGLNKYDGYTFTVYQSNERKKGSLSTSTVSCTYVDKKGVLYVATDNGGLNVYNSSTDKFTVYKHNTHDPQSIANNRVSAIFEDSKGVLWIALEDKGLHQQLCKSHCRR